MLLMPQMPHNLKAVCHLGTSCHSQTIAKQVVGPVRMEWWGGNVLKMLLMRGREVQEGIVGRPVLTPVVCQILLASSGYYYILRLC